MVRIHVVVGGFSDAEHMFAIPERRGMSWVLTLFPSVSLYSRVYVSIQAAFILTWALHECVRTSEPAEASATASPPTSRPVLVQAIKFAMSVLFFIGQRRSWFSKASSTSSRAELNARRVEEAVPLHGLSENGDERGEDDSHTAKRGFRMADYHPDVRIPPSLAVVLTLLASISSTYHDHLVGSSKHYLSVVLTLL